jgi:hypothetical protein
MGDLVAPGWLQVLGWSSAGLIVVINGGLLISSTQTWIAGGS